VIHRTAIIDPDAHLASDVRVGPYAVIGPRVTIGAGTVIGPHAVLECNARLGSGVQVGVGTVIGGAPQDLKYKGEETWVEIGDGTVLREYCTVNRGSSASGKTTVARYRRARILVTAN